MRDSKPNMSWSQKSHARHLRVKIAIISGLYIFMTHNCIVCLSDHCRQGQVWLCWLQVWSVKCDDVDCRCGVSTHQRNSVSMTTLMMTLLSTAVRCSLMSVSWLSDLARTQHNQVSWWWWWWQGQCLWCLAIMSVQSVTWWCRQCHAAAESTDLGCEAVCWLLFITLAVVCY